MADKVYADITIVIELPPSFSGDLDDFLGSVSFFAPCVDVHDVEFNSDYKREGDKVTRSGEIIVLGDDDTNYDEALSNLCAVVTDDDDNEIDLSVTTVAYKFTDAK